MSVRYHNQPKTRLAQAVSLMMVAGVDEASKISRHIGFSAFQSMKYHYLNIRSHAKSGAAALKRAAKRRNNIRKRA